MIHLDVNRFPYCFKMFYIWFKATTQAQYVFWILIGNTVWFNELISFKSKIHLHLFGMRFSCC